MNQTDHLESQLLATRRIILLRKAARAGLLASLLIQRRDLARDEAAGRVEIAKDRRVVIGELEAALEFTDASVSRFAELFATEAK